VYKIIVSEDAHNDIDEIMYYIDNKLENMQAAMGFLDDIEQSYRSLEGHPNMYTLCPDVRLREKGYRQIPIKNCLIFYRVDDVNNVVYIVRVVYGGREYGKLM